MFLSRHLIYKSKVQVKAGLMVYLLGFIMCGAAFSQKPKEWKPLAFEGGKLVRYADPKGDVIPDYSFSGYKQSEQPIPQVQVKRVIVPIEGDAGPLIQQALDEVSSLPADATGFRGAVLLQPGTYLISGNLYLKASGVVLRGSGSGPGGTLLLASGLSREGVVNISGKADSVVLGKYTITDSYVPVNSFTVSLADATSVKVGDGVWVVRPSTQNWISELGADQFGGGISALGWKPGENDIKWDRTVTAVNGNTVTLDAPLTMSLDAQYGGGFLLPYKWAGRVSNCGVENLAIQSTYDTANTKDEEHRWVAVSIDRAKDCWVRQVAISHFAGNAVMAGPASSRITVEDCLALSPVSEIGGWRRNAFFTAGQQTLFQRCYAENAMHPFAAGYSAAGPNAFVQCDADGPFSYSGSIQSMSPGLLFDVVRIDAQAILFSNLGQDENGAGWNTANSMLWNCSAAKIECWQPPTAQNWSYGSWAQFNGNGYWAESNNHLNPRSLFYGLLAQRLGRTADKQAFIMEISTDASSSPSVELAAYLTMHSRKPAPTLRQWIEKAGERNPISIDANGAQGIKSKMLIPASPIKRNISLELKNGWLLLDGIVAVGGRQDVPWWSGSIRPGKVQQAKPHITRYVPGFAGTGFTDNLDTVVSQMVNNNQLVQEHNYGLWYDRRRDDHERIRRMDGNVWAPFYELPFARSGKGLAYDGLSLYDLTKPNLWYWNRLATFAQIAEQNGRVLLQHHYFQHNIIEAGAHYADFPWRTANNVNNTPFPEPVPYAGDKRVFMDEWFYDTANATLNALHKNFIRQSLSNFRGQHNLIHTISAEYTGPLHFVQFWLDVIAAYEKETGEQVWVALSTTKDVQDAILQDTKRAAVVDIIDIRYWHYEASGNAYAPLGGQHLAPRQHARLLKPKKTSFEQVYRAVSEYKKLYPDKAVVYSGDSYPEFGIAAFMAGGSLAQLPPQSTDKALLKAAAGMKPVPSKNTNEYLLSNGKNKIIYNTSTKKLEGR